MRKIIVVTGASSGFGRMACPGIGKGRAYRICRDSGNHKTQHPASRRARSICSAGKGGFADNRICILRLSVSSK